MTPKQHLRQAADYLLGGGVIAYPTEGVYGLGCLPEATAAVARILDLKGRSTSAGLILIAPEADFLTQWCTPKAAELANLARDFRHPVTWVITAAAHTPAYLTGGRTTLAVRITDHPVVSAICADIQSAIVSTSANRSGHRPARSALQVRSWLGNSLDYVISGPLGDAAGPSEIRSAIDGQVIRPVMTTKPA